MLYSKYNYHIYMKYFLGRRERGTRGIEIERVVGGEREKGDKYLLQNFIYSYKL